MKRLPLSLCLLAHTGWTANLFDYDPKTPFDIKEVGLRQPEGADIHDITFANLAGGRTAAYLVVPRKRGKFAGIVFAHWYEPEAPNSNRTQFLGDAVTLAKKGAVSLLIETMWSDPNWFRTRRPAEDYENSIRQVKDFRRALDVLLSRREVDPKRVAFVGHDFGAMYGAVMAGVEKRVSAYAVLAGTTSFSDWFLLGSKLEGDERQKVIERLAVLDPVKYIASAAPSPVLFQFARSDRFVPEEKAQAFFEAAQEPKKILWYDAGHGLNEEAATDRIHWLEQVLRLK